MSQSIVPQSKDTWRIWETLIRRTNRRSRSPIGKRTKILDYIRRIPGLTVWWRICWGFSQTLRWIKSIQAILKPSYHKDVAGHLIFSITNIRMKFKYTRLSSANLDTLIRFLVINGTYNSCFKTRFFEIKGEWNEDDPMCLIYRPVPSPTKIYPVPL